MTLILNFYSLNYTFPYLQVDKDVATMIPKGIANFFQQITTIPEGKCNYFISVLIVQLNNIIH